MKTFFEHQSLARRNSRIMVALFLLAVAAALDCPMPPTIAALDPRLLRK